MVSLLLGDNEKELQFLSKEGEMIILDKSDPALKHLDYSFVLTNYKVQGKDAPFGNKPRPFNKLSENFEVP